MANLRDIRNRIRSVKNTGQITRAMQLVAASKMKRAQDKALQNRPYALLLADLIALVQKQAGGNDRIDHPLFNPRPVERRGILVVSTDKGLCGGLNANLFKQITAVEGESAFVAVGKKASQFLSRTKRQLLASFSVSDAVRFQEIRPVLQLLRESYESGEIDTIEVLYPRFVNTMVQEPVLRKVAPVTDLAEKLSEIRAHYNINLAEAQDDREYILEPSYKEMIGELAEMYLRREIFHMTLEAKASEHSARMVAMKAATDNAKKLVQELTLSYNKARQAAITQEILEISAATMYN
ncbi:MAG: ATP synthase F1 subunit gamma [Opitutales bacterium]